MAHIKNRINKGFQPFKKEGKKILDGMVFVKATFNNTIVTVTDCNGAVLFWSTSGKQGFRGSKKSTPFSAQIVGETVGRFCISYGIKNLRIKLNGPGPGRESVVRALYGSGIKISALEDVTPLPHNGCRPPKRRRV